MSDEGFLSRWSRRKTEARQDPQPAALPAEPAAAAPQPPTAPAGREAVPLPPVETLTPESDFAPFMQPGVEGHVKRAALKKLFGDPRFNVMDGLDVYIDDYSKPDPLPEGWLEKMNQVRRLGAFTEEPAPEPAAGAEEAAKTPGENPATPSPPLDVAQAGGSDRLPDQEADNDPTSRS